MASQYLDKTGLQHFYNNLKSVLSTKADKESIATSGNWKYVIHDNGTFEAWYYGTGESFDIKYASGTMYRSDPKQYTLPTALQSGTVMYFNGQIFHASFPVWGGVSSIQPPKIQAISGANRGSVSLNVNLYVVGSM